MPAAAASLTRSATTNGATPAASALDSPMAVRPNVARTAEPQRAAGVDHDEAGDHRENRREVAAIEAALGEVAGHERRERIRHQVAAGRPEQPPGARRQRRRRREHRQAGDAGREVQHLARRAEPRAEREAASSTTIGWNVNGTCVNGSGTLICAAAAVSAAKNSTATARAASDGAGLAARRDRLDERGRSDRRHRRNCIPAASALPPEDQQVLIGQVAGAP